MFAVKSASVCIDYSDPFAAPMSVKRKPRIEIEWACCKLFRDTREEENPVAYVEQLNTVLVPQSSVNRSPRPIEKSKNFIQKKMGGCVLGKFPDAVSKVGIFSANKLNIVILRCFIKD